MLSPLKLKRLEKSFTQYALHLLSGVPQARISYAERGYLQALKPGQWERIAEALGCETKEILPQGCRLEGKEIREGGEAT